MFSLIPSPNGPLILKEFLGLKGTITVVDHLPRLSRSYNRGSLSGNLRPSESEARTRYYLTEVRSLHGTNAGF